MAALDTSRPFTKYSRPAIGATPRPEEGAGYIDGPRPGSYANEFAQPVDIDAIYLYSDGKTPQVAFAGRGSTSVTYMSQAQFEAEFLVPVNVDKITSLAQRSTSSTGDIVTPGQPVGWAWTVSTGGG